MRRKLLALAMAGAWPLAGCSSVPNPVVPDGSNRAPINSPAKIEDYKARTAEETANTNERTALAREMEGLNRQVAALKASLLMLQADAEANRPQRPRARPVAQAVEPASVRPAPVEGVERVDEGGETIEVREQSVVFRVTHPFGKTEFKPSAVLEGQLLKAAREAKHIEIRGRTDAAFDNAINRDIASQRALFARRFLVSHGVAPSKIRRTTMAAGGNVADNKTIEGRAKNRRVEIETMDMNTTAFNSPGQGQTKLGSAP